MADAQPTQTVSTKVKLGGVEYELKDMTVQTGLTLFKGLTPAFQTQATQISEVVAMYGSVAEIAEKNGLNPTQLAQDFLRNSGATDAAKAARAQFSSATKTAISQLEAAGIDVKSLVQMVPGASTLMGTAHAAATVGNATAAVAGVAGAAIDGGWNGPERMWDLLGTVSSESLHQIIGYGSGARKDHALAFGAAVMALRQESLDQRHAQPMLPFSGSEQPSQLMSTPGAVTFAAWDAVVQWVKINLPVVSAAMQWLTTWGENKPSWDQFMAKAEEQSRQLEANKKDFQQLVDARMVGADNQHAQTVLEAAQTVAGLQTQGLAGVAVDSTTGTVNYRDRKGDDVQLVDGKEVKRTTPLDRVKEAGHAVVGDGSALEQTARGAAGVAAAATVANNGAKGFVRGMTAAVSNPSPTTEGLMSWARKPVQLGVGEHAITSGWKTWINFPGKIAVGVGDLAGRVTRYAGNTVAWMAEKVPGLVSAAPKVAKGAGVATLAIAPAVALNEMHEGEKNGDAAQVANAKGDLTTLAGDAGIGTVVAGTAAVIAGGGLAALSAPVLIGGAVVGAGVGGLVTLAGHLFDNESLQSSYAKVENTPDGLMDAAVAATKRAEDARVKAAGANLQMTGTKVTMGSTVPAANDQPSGTPQRQQTQQTPLRVS